MNARDVVTARIAEQVRRFPDVLLAPMEVDHLDARDAALAQAIEHAVMRRWLTLVRVIESRLSRPWDELEAKLQAVLLVGSAQLLLLERLPDHAVINESVEWAKRRVRAKAGGLVNAVLRKIAALRVDVIENQNSASASQTGTIAAPDLLPLHDGRSWKLNENVFDDHPLRRLAQQTSHSLALIQHWVKAFDETHAIALARHSIVHAPIIVHGLKPDADGAFSSQSLQPHAEAGFNVFSGERAELTNLLHSHPQMIVQDPTSAAPVRTTISLQPPPRLVIDACAGRGTKTRQLASVHPEARIVASDIDADRLEMLQQQFSNDDRVQVVGYRELHQFNGQADLLLLDVPCSNTGVLARRVEAKYRFSNQTQQKVVDLQRQVIADNLALLRDGGVLLYSTCSIESTENQQQAQWICKWHPFRVTSEHLQLPQGLPGDSPAMYRDGGYHALLQRKAGG